MGLKSWIAGLAINYAKPLIKQVVSVDKIAGYACDGIDWAAGKGLEGVGDERLVQVAKGCQLGASVLGNVAAAVDPTSEGGRAITERERLPIKANLREAVCLVMTQEQLDAIIDNACEAVLRKLK